MPEQLPLKLGNTGLPATFGPSDVVPPINGGVPGGGLTGNALIKGSSTDFDYNWGVVPGTGTTITPAQLTGDENEYDPTGLNEASTVRIESDSGLRGIKGLAWHGQSVKFRNVGSYVVFFYGNHPDASPEFQFKLPFDLALFPGQSVTFDYDETEEFWYANNLEDPKVDSCISYNPMMGSATLADYGILNMSAIAAGTIATVAGAGAITGHLRLATLAANNTGYLISMPKAMPQIATYNNAYFECSAVVSLAVLSDATDRFTAALQITQLTTNTTLLQANSVGIRYTDNENSGRWYAYTRTGVGVESVLDSGVTVAIDTHYRLRVSHNKTNTEARFYVNDICIGKINTNLPNNGTAAGYRVIMIKTSGTTNIRNLRCHQFTARTILAI